MYIQSLNNNDGYHNTHKKMHLRDFVQVAETRHFAAWNFVNSLACPFATCNGEKKIWRQVNQ